MCGEVVQFSGLEAERFGEKVELNPDSALLLLAEEAEQAAPVKGGNVADDGSILGKVGGLAGLGVGLVQVSGGVDQLEFEGLFS